MSGHKSDSGIAYRAKQVVQLFSRWFQPYVKLRAWYAARLKLRGFRLLYWLRLGNEPAGVIVTVDVYPKMMRYIATFHTHFAALCTFRALQKAGTQADMAPVPSGLARIAVPVYASWRIRLAKICCMRILTVWCCALTVMKIERWWRMMRLSQLLAIPKGITAVVGGGGKTSLIWKLAMELSHDAHVLLTTTTHIWPPRCQTLLSPTREQVTATLDSINLLAIGDLQADGKLSEARSLQGDYVGLADYVLVEADGSCGLPLKAPAEHEPALPDGVVLTIAVAGMDCVGQRIADVAHRPTRYAALVGAGVDAMITPQMVAEALMHPRGQHKGVSRSFAVVLNQADTPDRLCFARAVAKLLPMEVLITAFQAKPEWQEQWRYGVLVE